jgi:hypothetical protein
MDRRTDVSERIENDRGDLRVILSIYGETVHEVEVVIPGGLPTEVGAEFSGRVVRVVRKVTEQ